MSEEKKQERPSDDLRPCRYCKTPIEKGLKRCPVCGTLTPHSDTKTTLKWIGIILLVVWGYSMVRSLF
ncbi:hypothetical protein [Nitratifractor sp.]